MKLKTVMFVETDEEGNIEWSEGCVCVDDVYEYSMELVSKEDAEKIINSLQERISNMSWELNPERMGR